MHIWSAEDILYSLEGNTDAYDVNEKPFIDEKGMAELFDSHVVYFLYKNGACIYVGKTKHLMTRISEHNKNGRDFDSIAFIFVNEKDIDFIEFMFITIAAPTENIRNWYRDTIWGPMHVIHMWDMGIKFNIGFDEKQFGRFCSLLNKKNTEREL
jgi:hypothetical protein